MRKISWQRTLFLALVIFIISLATYYYPVYQKGYPPGADYENLMEARNFAVAKTYQIESAKGVLLSSENIKQSGIEKGFFNPLTPIIYGQIFKYFGFNQEWPFYISITLFSLFNVLIFLLSKRLLGVTIGFMSGIAVSLIPVMTVGAIHSGFYEWGVIFFGLALWFYLGSNKGAFQSGKVRIFIASTFFALSALSRNAFAISFVPFFIYDLYIHKSLKRSLIFLLPFLVLFGSTLTTYSWLGVPNGYSANIEQQPFDLIGHYFRDAYTFYYDKDNFIREMSERELQRPAVLFADQWGYDVSFSERIGAYFDSFTFYIKETLNFTSTGGPVILGLMLLGAVSLYRLNKRMLGLFVIWWFLWIGYLVYDKTGNWDHLMEIVFIFSTLAGLGLYRLIEIINERGIYKMTASLFILVLFVGQMTYANKWKLHDIYRSSKEETILRIKEKLGNNSWNGVYAVGVHPDAPYSLNYKLDHDLIYFDPKTIESLVINKKLKEAFEIYKISAVLGYDEKTTDKIKSQVPVQSIPID